MDQPATPALIIDGEVTLRNLNRLADYGELHDTTLRCRVHGFEFDVLTGRCEHDPRLHLRRYPVTVIGDEVWVDLL